MSVSIRRLTIHHYLHPMSHTPQRLTPQQALPKLQHYCAYQERCHSEVKDKLAEYGVFGDDAAQIISELIQEDYLNEERFALQFAGGRFRTKQWGRRKIQYTLKQKGVSDYCIRKALRSIDEEDYEQTLMKLSESKWSELKKEKIYLSKKESCRTFCCSAGLKAAGWRSC